MPRKNVLTATVKHDAPSAWRKGWVTDYGSAKIKLALPGGEEGIAFAKPDQEDFFLKVGASVSVVHDKGKIYKIENYGDDAIDTHAMDRWDDNASSDAPTQPAALPSGGDLRPRQPLDVVGADGREDGLNAELTLRLKLMHRAVKGAARSLAQNTGNWEPLDKDGEPVPSGRIVDPTRLDQKAVQGLAATLLIGLFDPRGYFEGGNHEASN